MRKRPNYTPRVNQLKQEALAHLEAGDVDFILDYKDLPTRERDKVRFFINRWLRHHGLYGRNSFDRETEFASVQILGKREDRATPVFPEREEGDG